MRRLMDISVPMQAGIALDPPGHLPEIDYYSHADTAEDVVAFFPGATVDDLPDRGGLGDRTGALVDPQRHAPRCPYHYSAVMDGGARAITIDQVPLDWCLQPAVKLDFRHLEDGYVATAALGVASENLGDAFVRPAVADQPAGGVARCLGRVLHAGHVIVQRQPFVAGHRLRRPTGGRVQPGVVTEKGVRSEPDMVHADELRDVFDVRHHRVQVVLGPAFTRVEPGGASTPITPPVVATARSTSSGFIRGLGHRARAPAWLITTGWPLASAASVLVRSPTWARSTSMPS
jgi:hypothetical protein